ncbi:protein BIG GRAIN 1-like A [Durio zibethinus]|uniref:Protein BIG GRAIN 1-like A n=1 Tax=Durio zibethinus TaxID=66656 RepID=A0A6P5WH09_DURZI|nr:protein BIG GRAIN 1-like A [Durio zibethinus]XP_022715238.1 protein BIG GRAIN 1-like A [Durio zibethinus]XP_022715240.1 protein BIG GRAIN 1-like A [Durio zibethinus]XP_022715241.1 protein BIG GRAIN 1-like A [Durio zibethinus]XP_022715242.1 protein BIG GRAIN 1-like A [Durio zibethinus]XP_022715243.1 protein BIG GRAIN 1-like A [Durio zibethinus]XP_022715244.1 protein BIG GRAIN 1-like A [Durio zibethinus]
MDMWDKLPREDRYRNRRESPSFSSTLLDAIYRSIDESNGSKGEEELIFYRETTMRKKHSNNSSLKEEEMTNLQRACMIEKWMEKKVSCDNRVAIRRKSMADSERNSRNDFDPMLLNSSSSSSDSSCGGGFSSSESDSFYGAKSRSSSSSSSHYTTHRPKPIRTSVSARPEVENSFHAATQQKPKHEGGFVRTKSKAFKIYSDLKKFKQPISPGGRLASFLNSLFTAGNAKKAKISSSGYEERKLKSEQATSTCSSASSFSRSCLSKTPSSRGKLSSNGTKRSVRFCPVSVILDEDSRPCGHKNILHEKDHQTSVRKPINKELEFRIMEENRRVVEAAKDLLKSYQKKKEEYDMREIGNGNDVSSDDEEDDEDAASYASSDLFELDNLSVIGIERYREELPVYETTHLDTNQAIANGLIM